MGMGCVRSQSAVRDHMAYVQYGYSLVRYFDSKVCAEI